jgi:acyl-CoA hydrolase
MDKCVDDSLTRISYHIRAQDMNQYGSIHGGRLLTLADEIGFLAAHHHAGERCLTVGVHQARFYRGAGIDMQLAIEARVALVGRTSLWVPVHMTLAGEDIMDAVYVYVAVDAGGAPSPVPAIVADTQQEKALQARMQSMRAAFLEGRP